MNKKIIIAGATALAAALAVAIKHDMEKEEIFFGISEDVADAMLSFNNRHKVFKVKAEREGLYFIPKKEGAISLTYEGTLIDGTEFKEEYVFQSDEDLQPKTYRINDNDEMEEI